MVTERQLENLYLLVAVDCLLVRSRCEFGHDDTIAVIFEASIF